MQLCETNDIKFPVVKCGTAIAAAGTANTTAAGSFQQQLVEQATYAASPEWLLAMLNLPWGHIASMIAAFYTGALLLEWFWKKPLHWLLVKAGWKQPKVAYTEEEWLERIGKKK